MKGVMGAEKVEKDITKGLGGQGNCIKIRLRSIMVARRETFKKVPIGI